MAGIYIHVPFCKTRCIYCDFYSTTRSEWKGRYIEALCKELEMRYTYLKGKPIETLYFGGGTPSQLDEKDFRKVFDTVRRVYGMENCHEITLEANPDDLCPEYLQMLSELPFNRISMGIQTFDDTTLKLLKRRHNAAQAIRAVELCRAHGFRNISIDLMFGFPGETLEDWKKDIDEAIKLEVEHISAYSLMYEEGTTLYRMLERGKIEEIDEETSRQMYELLITQLTSAGYEHYEISNFAKPGYRSRHNSSYWHEVPYIGIGAAAHSYRRETKRGEENKIEATRSWNVDNIREYIASIQKGELPSETESLDLSTRYNDLITTALRTSDGIDIEKMEKEFGDQLASQMMQEAEKHIHRGLMKISNGKLSLTHEGLYISDDIMSDFMIV